MMQFNTKQFENVIVKFSIVLFLFYCVIKDNSIITYTTLEIVSFVVFISIVISFAVDYKKKRYLNWYNCLYISFRNCIIFGLGSISLIMLLNYSFQNNKLEIIETKCVDIRVFKPNSEYEEVNKVYFLLDNSFRKSYFTVEKSDYNKIKIGDSILVYYRTGMLGYKVLISYSLKSKGGL